MPVCRAYSAFVSAAFGLTLALGAGCTSSSGPECGDGRVQGGEACDDGNTLTESRCVPGVAACTACAADCSAALALTGPVLSIVSGDGQSGWVAAPLDAPLAVRVTDGGKPVAGFHVEWIVASGGGSVVPETSVTDAAGTAAAVWTLGPEAGHGEVSATAAGAAGSPVLFGATALERELELVRATSGTVADVLPVRVDATGGVREVLLDMDGELLGAFATGEELWIDVASVPEGRHVLRARGAPGEPPVREASSELIVDRGPPRVVEVRPPPGAHPAGGSFAVELVFSEPIDPASVDDVAFVVGNDALPGASQWLSLDRRTLRVELAGAFKMLASVYARAIVADDAGRLTWVYQGPWFARSVVAGFDAPDGRSSYTNATVRIAAVASVTAASGAPAQAILRAGDQVIGSFGPPPWPEVLWDTRSVPEGTYALTLEVPGYVVQMQREPPRVVVDRTPPSITCTPRAGGSDGSIGLTDCIEVTADEWVVGSFSPVLLADGVPIEMHVSGSPTSLPMEVCPMSPLAQPPFVETLDLGATGARDLAGNPAVIGACTFDVPVWRSPWGPGPIATAAGPISATAVVFESLGSSARLAWIAAPGQAQAGKILGAKTLAPAAWPEPSVIGPVNGDASSLSISGGRVAWVEREPGAPGRAMLAAPAGSGWTVDSEAAGLLNAPGGLDASEVAVPAFVQLASGVVAWCEEDPAGGRTLRAKSRESGRWKSLVGDVREDPAAVVSELSLSDNEPGHTPFQSTFATFLETSPGGVPRVRAATARPVFADDWLQITGAFNDGSSAPSEPSGWAYGRAVVAWVESGRVLARSAAFDSGVFDSAKVLNADPTRAARSPVATGGRSGRTVVVFVEEGPTGDEIWARVWDGAGWTLVPGSVNADSTGPVTFLSVTPGPAVAWIDGGGNVRVRLANF